RRDPDNSAQSTQRRAGRLHSWKSRRIRPNSTPSSRTRSGWPIWAMPDTNFCSRSNPAINFVRRRFGLVYWSLSAYAKKRVKDAVSFIGEFEKAIVRYAEKFRVDAVLCGHIHSASIHQLTGVTYYNCGDWVESCTAMVERHDGAIELVSYPPFPVPPSAKIAVPEGVL